jgi:hypothetical protein
VSASPSGGRAARPAIRWFGWAAVAGLLTAALVAPGSAATADGNNGTVKIHEGSTETEPIVRNEPHVCTFHLHFFFADPADSGTWEIQEWSPGDKGTVVLEGTYDTNGDGEDRDPDEGAYELPDGHYKLFWDGDLHSEKHDKHKVFWVDCAAETAGPTPTFGQSQEGETDAPTGTPVITEAPTGTPIVTTPPSFGQTQGGQTQAPTMTFGQTQGGATEVPGGNVTQPPTDTLPTATPDAQGWRWLLVALAVLLATVLLLTPSPQTIRRH